MAFREDFIHYQIRNHLRRAEWVLLAGQYPNGSDDEIPSLNIMDPELARDKSPDHRRHSKNKLVPDLVAQKRNNILVIEMKPRYSADDESKLFEIINTRRNDFLASLNSLLKSREIKIPYSLEELVLIPALGFSSNNRYLRKNDICYFLVESDIVHFLGNNQIESLD